MGFLKILIIMILLYMIYYDYDNGRSKIESDWWQFTGSIRKSGIIISTERHSITDEPLNVIIDSYYLYSSCKWLMMNN